jgi:hypothetical protein
MIDRRGFLRRLGAGSALVAGVLSPLVPLGAVVEPPALPRRLLLVFTANGTIGDAFWPSGGGSDFTFAQGSILEPLAPFRSKLLIPRGARRILEGPGGNHPRAMGGLWTGERLSPGHQFGGGGWARGPSLDQIVADAIEPRTRFRTLELAVQPGSGSNATQRMIYASADRPVHPIADPARAFSRIFGPADPVGAQRLVAERRSRLDALRGELHSLRGELVGDARANLDAHLEATRGLERRLSNVANECAAKRPTGHLDLVANDSFPTIGARMTEVVVAALACGATTIASLQWSRSFSATRHTWLGIEREHHELSHDLRARADLVAIERWYAARFAELLAQLDAVAEGDGTLLDHTLVVWANELADGATHAPGPQPVVIAGGGAMRLGRVVDLGEGVWWNQVLVSIAHAMGAKQIERIGSFGPAGPAPGLA